jgi:uncharacterized membrane protein YphA (DoxX/SURF4 family)
MRRNKLQKLFSAFPGGWPGLGLILLRIAVASHAIAYGLNSVTSLDLAKPLAWSTGLLAMLVGLAILIGFLTPLAGGVATTGYLALGLFQAITAPPGKLIDSSIALYLAVVSLALILLGPGAFSVDARLFGRREIIIP